MNECLSSILKRLVRQKELKRIGKGDVQKVPKADKERKKEQNMATAKKKTPAKHEIDILKKTISNLEKDKKELCNALDISRGTIEVRIRTISELNKEKQRLEEALKRAEQLILWVTFNWSQVTIRFRELEAGGQDPMPDRDYEHF